MTSYKGYLSVFGGLLIHLTLGTLYCWGNLNPYVTSYIRTYSSPSTLEYSDTVWVFGLNVFGQGAAMYFGGLLEKRIGTRLAALVGCFLFSISVFLTAFTVKVSYYLLLLTHGLCFGLGMGLTYIIPLGLAIRWFPQHKGVASGFIVAGTGVGAFIFDQVQIAYLNPLNVKTVSILEDGALSISKYFVEESVLVKVPNMFMLLGGCYFAIQLIGIGLLFPVDLKKSDEDTELLVKKSSIQYLYTENNYPVNGKDLPVDSKDHPVDSKDHPADRNKQVAKGEKKDRKADTRDEEGFNTHPLQMIKTRPFITLWFMLFLNNACVILVSTLYKTYGQSEVINDDQFLTLLGSVSALCNGVGRISWGFAADKTSFRTCMITLSGLMVLLMATLYLSHVFAATAGKYLFFTWICLLYLTFSGNFSLFPTACSKTFGSKYVSENYGLLFSSSAFSGIIASMLSTLLLETIMSYGVFIFCATISAISFVLAISFNGRGEDGKVV